MEENNLTPGTGSGDQFAATFHQEAREPVEPEITKGQDSSIDELDPTAGESSIPLPETPEPEPIFKKEEPVKEDVFEPKIKKWDKEELNDNLELILNVRNMIVSQLLAFVAGDEETEAYEMDEREMNKLARVWAPYIKKHGGKIPDWLLIVMAEGMVMTPVIKRAWTNRKRNREYKEMVADPEMQATVQQFAAAKKRKNYVIDRNGFYCGKPGSTYINIPDRTEKANIADIEFIIRDNDLQLVKKIFPDFNYGGK